jgi:hypothetical protein
MFAAAIGHHIIKTASQHCNVPQSNGCNGCIAPHQTATDYIILAQIILTVKEVKRRNFDIETIIIYTFKK